MSYYGMVTEDPGYDEDGVLVDEIDEQNELADELAALGVLPTYDPFDTVNS